MRDCIFLLCAKKLSRATIATAQSCAWREPPLDRGWSCVRRSGACGTAGRDLLVATPNTAGFSAARSASAADSPAHRLAPHREIGLILSLSAQGNAGLVSAQMKNAAEMAACSNSTNPTFSCS